jgi:hypothetical protein
MAQDWRNAHTAITLNHHRINFHSSLRNQTGSTTTIIVGVAGGTKI